MFVSPCLGIVGVGKGSWDGFLAGGKLQDWECRLEIRMGPHAVFLWQFSNVSVRGLRLSEEEDEHEEVFKFPRAELCMEN